MRLAFAAAGALAAVFACSDGGSTGIISNDILVPGVSLAARVSDSNVNNMDTTRLLRESLADDQSTTSLETEERVGLTAPGEEVLAIESAIRGSAVATPENSRIGSMVRGDQPASSESVFGTIWVFVEKLKGFVVDGESVSERYENGLSRNAEFGEAGEKAKTAKNGGVIPGDEPKIATTGHIHYDGNAKTAAEVKYPSYALAKPVVTREGRHDLNAETAAKIKGRSYAEAEPVVNGEGRHDPKGVNGIIVPKKDA
ncbi:unnamed protein product [Hyaloperonospora brassicae]|uniref:RXLR effector n=1 Tax=Hyaloperonospora brassicae TaxID=162125 RepID=A0AAV0T541_HYABA|nr:unnamed protein product [Hyaloperonospora brassicae]